MNGDWWIGLKLKPCPFCGKKLVRKIYSSTSVWFEHSYPSSCILVENCETLVWVDDQESAEKWNQRHFEN